MQCLHRHAYYKYIAIAVILAASLEFPRFFEMRLEDGNGTWGKLQFTLYFFHCTQKKQGKYFVLFLWFLLWQYRLWSFQTGGTKLERFWPKHRHTQRKLLNLRIGLVGRCQKVKNHPTSWLSRSIFYIKNCPNLSKFFFHWRISI